MRRVLVRRGPDLWNGSAFGSPECDSASSAAIDLAERDEMPVEWVALSSGARIADRDRGTENLDATARVVTTHRYLL